MATTAAPVRATLPKQRIRPLKVVLSAIAIVLAIPLGYVAAKRHGSSIDNGAVVLMERGTRVLGEYRGGLQQGVGALRQATEFVVRMGALKRQTLGASRADRCQCLGQTNHGLGNQAARH